MLEQLGINAKKASANLAGASTELKNKALEAIANALVDNAQKIIDARDEGLTFDIRDDLDGSSQILTAFLTDEAKAKYNATTSNPLAGSSESNQTISENKSNKLYDIDDGGPSWIKNAVGRNINETINIFLAINIRCSKCYNAKCNVIK